MYPEIISRPDHNCNPGSTHFLEQTYMETSKLTNIELKEWSNERYSFLQEKDSFVFKAYDTILKLDDFDNQLYQIRFVVFYFDNFTGMKDSNNFLYKQRI